VRKRSSWHRRRKEEDNQVVENYGHRGAVVGDGLSQGERVRPPVDC
jgi:hypothetical protein